MYVEDHYACCGATILRGFMYHDEHSIANLDRQLSVFLTREEFEKLDQDEQDDFYDDDGYLSDQCLEVILTDEQSFDEGWHDTLLDRGFKWVFRFRNPNTENMCNYYLRSDASEPLVTPSIYKGKYKTTTP